jgi:hypothetical protein
MRQHLLPGIETQPAVQQIALPDRFDHRWVGALEIHGCNPINVSNADNMSC